MENVWKCPKCGAILKKGNPWLAELIKSGTSLTGVATCGNCQALFKQSDAYSGKYDFGNEMEDDTMPDLFQDVDQLVLQLQQGIIGFQIDPQDMYHFLQANLDKLTPTLAQQLTQWAAAILPDIPSQEAFSIAVTLAQFSQSLQNFPLGNRTDNLEIAIAGYKATLVVFTKNTYPELRAATHNGLGFAYTNRIREERDENLEQAIIYCQLALQVFTRQAFPMQWAGVHGNLANAYAERIRGERSENLEQAIKYGQLALEVFTQQDFPHQWARMQNNLGEIYRRRIRGERAQNIEQAIEHHRSALQIRTRQTFPEGWATTHLNLGEVFRERIRGERAENLERAIEYYHLALQIYSQQAFPEDWSMIQNNLAITFFDRIKGDRADNLEKTLEHCQLALQVRTRQNFPREWAATQINLANAYLYRIRGERAENLEQAIEHCQLALQIRTRQAFAEDWAMVQHNLATVYVERIRGERAENLEQAIEHCQLALQVYTRQAFPEQWALTQHNLGEVFRERIRGERAENLEQAVKYCQLALQIFTRETSPANHLRTLHNLSLLHFNEQNWKAAYTNFTSAIETGDVLLAETYTEIGRQAEVGKTSHMFARAAYCLLQMGQPNESFVHLEQGKTRLLAEALALSNVDLALLPETQRQAMLEARQLMHELEAEMRLPPDTPARRNDRELAEALREARSSLNNLITNIRTEHPDFMPTGLELSDLLGLIPASGVLVAPLVTSQGSAVFVLPHGTNSVSTEDVIWLNDFTNDDLNALLLDSEDEPGWLRAYGTGSPQVWQTTLEVVTGNLWSNLLKPVHERLIALDLAEGATVLLMPQGGLGLLPLHAAWREVNGVKRTFLDDYTVTYAPSGYALNVSQRRLHDENRHHNSLMAVINPTGDLPFTSMEGETIALPFDAKLRQVLVKDKATREAVNKESSSHSYLHFACHGFYNWQNAMHSGLVLAGDEPLTLSEIISKLDLSATRLIILSACETGITEFQQTPDEYIGLPAGFLQAGAPGVISSLWAVNDLSTALLMQRFYQLHLQDKLPPAAALRQAQLWLRNLTLTELEQRNATVRDSDPFLYTKLEQEHRRLLTEHNNDKTARPFSHPYYWAAFTFTGC